MDKKVVTVVYPGLPYRKTVFFGCERAKEMGAKHLLLGIIPEFNEPERVALAMHEIAPYETVTKKMEDETVEFLERAAQFCLDLSITIDTHVERGGMEEIIKRMVKDKNIKLVVVPAPTTKAHHAAFFDVIRQFAHNMLDYELRCPVVSVLAT